MVTTQKWSQRSRFYWEDTTGYRIAVAVTNGAWRYAVFAPTITNANHNKLLKPRYARGEYILSQREPLGVFDDPETARAACARHAEGANHAYPDQKQNHNEGDKTRIRSGDKTQTAA